MAKIGDLVSWFKGRRMAVKVSIPAVLLLVAGSVSFLLLKRSPKPTAPFQSLDINDEIEGFHAVDFGPVGSLEKGIARPDIYVVFSDPVVPLAKLGEPITQTDVITINPRVSGLYRWYGTRYLSFTPDEPLNLQTTYRISIKRNLKSQEGESIKGSQSFNFSTDPLKMIDFFPGTPANPQGSRDVPLEEGRAITLVFNAEVDPQSIGRTLSVWHDGVTYPFDIEHPRLTGINSPQYHRWYLPDFSLAEMRKRMVILTLKKELKENGQVIVVLPEGTASKKGQAPTTEEMSGSYGTLYPFSLQDVNTAQHAYSLPGKKENNRFPIYFEFSHRLGVDGVVNPEDITTNPPMEIKAENISVSYRSLVISGLPVKARQEITIKVNSSKIKDIYGRSFPRETIEEVVTFPSAPSYSYFNVNGRMVITEAAYPPRLLLEHQNVNHHRARLAHDSLNDPYRPLYTHSGTEWSGRWNRFDPYDISKGIRDQANFDIFDLSPHLNEEGYGTVYYQFLQEWEERWNGKTYDYVKQNYAALQVTNLGLTTRIAYNKIIAMVGHLDDGTPVSGATVILYHDNSKQYRDSGEEWQPKLQSFNNGITDENGIVVFDVAETNFDISHLRFRVEDGSDSLDFRPNYSHNIYRTSIPTISLDDAPRTKDNTLLFTDRGLFKPGETVTFAGISRKLHLGTYMPNGETSHRVTVNDPNTGDTLYSESLDSSPGGLIHGSFQLPATVKPGWYSIQSSNGSVSFQVALFRRLSFTVAIEQPEESLLYSGDTLSAVARATYLAGGGLGGASYDTAWFRNPLSYRPPGENWRGYTFGPNRRENGNFLGGDEGVLDASGSVQISKKTGNDGVIGQAYTYTVETRVMDDASQEVAARKAMTVHPSSLYIGVKSDTYFMEKGESASFSILLLSPDGEKYEEKVEVKAELLNREWRLVRQQGVAGAVNSRYEEVTEAESNKSLRINGSGEVKFTPKKSGGYTLRLTASDADGRRALTELRLYSTGSGYVYWFSDDADSIGMEVDKSLYNPGDTATILLKSPLPQGRYLVTIEREGILEERVVEVEGSASTIEVPIKDSYIPVVYVSVATYSGRTAPPPDERGEPDLGKPQGYFGITPLFINSETRSIDVTIEQSKDIYKPGEEAEVTIKTAMDGRPASDVEVIFLAVDRGVVDLINYHVPDPLAYFYNASLFPLGVYGAESRSLLIDPVTYALKDLQGGDGGKDQTRSDFSPTAVFRPDLVTDANGEATLRFTLPDTLTTYRCTAIAVTPDHFSREEQDLEVQNIVNMKTSLPRKMRPGDEADLGVLLTNLSEESLIVGVEVEATLLNLAETSANETISPGETRFISFKATAPQEGEVKLSFRLRSKLLNETLIETLIVEKPYIFESFTTTGRVRGEIKTQEETLILPTNAVDDKGDVILSLSAGNFALLKESVRYLHRYPYGCVEQRTSALIPHIVLGDAVNDINPEVPNWTRSQTEAGIARITALQAKNGGFYYWPERKWNSTSLFTTTKVAHMILAAEEYGYSLRNNYNRAELIDYLKRAAESFINDKHPRLYRRPLYAYAIYLAGYLDSDNNASSYVTLLERVMTAHTGDDELRGITELAYMGLLRVRAGDVRGTKEQLRRLRQYIKPGTRSIDLAEVTRRGTMINSEVEQLSLLLMLLAQTEDKSGLDDKVAATLLSRQRKGRWGGTVRNVWALIALSQWNKPVNKSFAGTVTLNDTEILRGEFENRASPNALLSLPFTEEPLNALPKGKPQTLSFNFEGPDKEDSLFYSAELRYTIPVEEQVPRDEGLGVYTEITDLSGNIIKDGELKIGETYRMSLYLSSARDREYVMAQVSLPSGAETQDGSFVTTARRRTSEEEGGEFDRNPSNYSIFIYDNRVEVAYEFFRKGYRKASFLFRATASGSYPTPPTHAECMYEPEVFGRTGGVIYNIVR